ncbi:MAG: RlmE family RNA methyltransferase [Myxococcota bacterium]|nr:RlmE family RNA methyltransferase [Myxococcota bacterium]
MGSRRHSDHYTKKAQQAGYAARSVYKLDEINTKHRLFRRGQRVVDLGCAPGSWLKYIAQRVGKQGLAIGIDRTEVEPFAPNICTFVGDIYEFPRVELLDAAGGPIDVLTSDMAPDTTGNRFTDHVRSIALCEVALDIALTMLKPGGSFVCKVFEGPDLHAYIQTVRAHFTTVKRMKPKSTRAESVELFVIGLTKK